MQGFVARIAWEQERTLWQPQHRAVRLVQQLQCPLPSVWVTFGLQADVVLNYHGDLTIAITWPHVSIDTAE